MANKIVNNYLPELSALIFGRSTPSMVTVNLTNKCQQNCIYCEIGNDHPLSEKNTLTLSDLTWIVDQMALIKMPKISICGGEPFLFDGVVDIVDYAAKKNIRCSITTNGMTAHKLKETELSILKETKTEINISIDSFQKNIQSYTRGTRTSLTNALKSVQKLHERKIPVTVLTVITKHNYFELANFIVEAHKIGIRQVLFQPVIYASNYPDITAVDRKSELNVGVEKLDTLIDELKKVLEFEKKHNIKTNVYRILPWIRYYITAAVTQNGEWFFNKVLNQFYCREVHAIIDISYTGGIQPCGLSMATINIHENRDLGLLTLWRKATSDIKDDLLNDRYHEYCNSCCHHFSRNMLASIMKYPIKNRMALVNMFSLMFWRALLTIHKKLFIQY